MTQVIFRTSICKKLGTIPEKYLHYLERDQNTIKNLGTIPDKYLHCLERDQSIVEPVRNSASNVQNSANFVRNSANFVRKMTRIHGHVPDNANICPE